MNDDLGLGDIFSEFNDEQAKTEESRCVEIITIDSQNLEIMPLEAGTEGLNPFGHLSKNDQLKTPYVSPAVRYITSLRSEASQNTMHYALKRVARVLKYEDYKKCPWEGLNVDAVSFIVNALIDDGLSPKTINTYLTAVKQVCRHAWLDKLMDHDTFLRICHVKGASGTRVSKGRSLVIDEIRDLLGTCRDFTKPINIRDAAIIALTRACGLRRQEVTLLTNKSIDPESGIIIVRGKGDKERKLSVPSSILPIIKRWTNFKDEYNWKRAAPEALFNPLHKTGCILAKPISAMAIHEMFEKRRLMAGVAKFSPHDLRRTFATELLKADTEITDVQKMMGHSSVATTQIYDKRNDDRILDIMKESVIF